MKKRIASLTLCFLLFSAFLTAQGTFQTGTISGKVVDNEGNPLPGVTVTITSEALIKGTQSAITTPGGTCRFVFLPVGTYNVSFALQGFKTLVKEGVEVALRKTTTVNATLEVTTIEETITVVGETPVIDIKSSTIATNFTIEMLQKIPSARDPWVLMEMTPGMVMNTQNIGGSESGQQSRGYAHGTMSDQTAYNMDGIQVTDAAASGATAMYFDFDSFEEISIETGAHSTDIQTSGVVLNMITKSGGNKFSGGISLYGETESLQANNIPEDDPAYEGVGFGNPTDYVYDYGGDLGGPIIKDRLWFYSAFRRTEINRFVIGYEVDGNPGLEYTDLKHWVGKLTWQITDNNKFMGWVNYDAKAMPNRSAGPRRPPETTYFQDSPSWFYHLEDTWTLSPDLLLNVKFGWYNMYYQLAPQDSVDMSQPAVLVYYSEPYRRMYDDAYYQYTWYYSDRYALTAYADYFKDDFLGGDHELKVGFEYQKTPFRTTRKYPGNHTLYVDYPDRTGAYQVWTFREVEWSQTNEIYSAYVQDTFTLSKYLTINFGLRFDSTYMHTNETTVPGNMWTDYYTERTGEPVPLHAPAKKNVVHWNTLYPRIGFTFDLFNDGNNVFKANFARYSFQASYEPAWRVIETSYWEVDYSWDDANGDKMAQTNELGSIRYTDFATEYEIDSDLKSPYVDEFTVGFERKLTNDLGFSVNFLYRKNKRFMWTDNRALDPQVDYIPLTIQDPGPDGDLGTGDDGGNITVYEMNDDKIGVIDYFIHERPGYEESYRGVEFVLNKRYADKWQLMASLTYGKTNVTRPLEAVDDPNNQQFQDGVPQWNNAPLIIKVMGSVELPFGFTFGGFINYRSGFPSQRYFYERLNQGDVEVETQKYGSERYPNLLVADFRLSKIFRLGKFGVFEVMADVFNIFNKNTTLDWDQESWSGYQDIFTVLAPRILRLGVKWQF